MPENTAIEIINYLFQKPIYVFEEQISIPLRNLEGVPVSAPKLLLLLKNAFNHAIPAGDIELLNKLADWLGVERKHVAVHLLEEDIISFSDIRSHYGIENIICYGGTPAQLGLHIEYHRNKPIRFMSCRIIFTASFAEVQNDVPLKKEFFSEAGKLFIHFKSKKS